MKKFVATQFRRTPARLILVVMAVGAFVATASLPAQEALRASLAGQDMAERRKLELSRQKFNVLLGPVGFRFNASLGLEATDNVYSRESGRQADLTIRPQFNMFSAWRVTEKNTLTLGLGVGYTKYLNATEYDSFFISPDTDLSFDVYVGDFVINLHNRFDYSQDISSDPTVSGRGSLNRFENTAGVGVTWDLNKLIASFGYDHRIFIPTDSGDERLEYSAELFTAGVMFRVRPTVTVGLEAGGGLMDYRQEVLQDNTHIAVGPSVSVQLTEYTSFRLGAGYVTYRLDTYGQTNLTADLSGVYLHGSIQQRLGNLVEHTLSFGRSVQSGITSDLVEAWRIQHGARWNVLRKTGVSTTLSYEHVEGSLTQGESLDRYGFGIQLSRTLTKKMTGSVGYQFYLKDSDTPNRDYTQNRLVLNVGYAF